MGQLCALPPALDPLLPPPPNISRLDDVWDHWTRCNVRRGGRRKAEMAKKPIPVRGLISHDRVAKLQDGPWIRCNDAAISC